MSVFGGLKRILGQKEEGEAFIETRLDRFAASPPPPPPPPPPPLPTATGQPIAPSDPLGSGLPPLAPPAPAHRAPAAAAARPLTPPEPVPAVEEDIAPAASQPAPRPKARPSGAAVRLLMEDGSTSELDDPELAARAEYLVKNLLSPKPPGPES